MLTVLYDADCALCARFRNWLAAQPLLVPLSFVAAGSADARHRFPTLDHERTKREITVVGDNGSVWTQEHAWVMCLWATRAHRGLAEQAARPGWLPLARAVAASAAGLRHLLSPRPGGSGGDYPDPCAGSCSPLPQG